MKNLVMVILLGLLCVTGGEVMAKQATAIVAGGCFWCIESEIQDLPGVKEAISGYTGGTEDEANYHDVSSGQTDHLEAVQVVYDPDEISYLQILNVFWQNIDPTDSGGQFADRGNQYKTAIFYKTDEEKKIAEDSKKALEASGRFKGKIVTPILPEKPFYPAEDNHQDYYKKNSMHYNMYKVGSGRAGFIKEKWEKK